jgi:p38 MAP kinase
LKILDFGLARTQEPEMTGYVATRWYRSPEIMLNWTHYGRELDIWSVGCIMAELLTRQPLFPGTDHVNQLNLITEKLGTPSEDVIRRIESETARRYVQSLPQRRGTPMEALVPGASPPAIDLLKKMLEFDTLARWNVDQCLAHPYFQGLHDPNDEPTSATVFDSSFDAVGYTAERIRDLTMTELLSYKRD